VKVLWQRAGCGYRFKAIKGLSFSGAKSILEEREKGGDFTSLNDFSKRININRDDIIALCLAGVLTAYRMNCQERYKHGGYWEPIL
jgi:DNA polymerase III alpha subunit